MQRRIRRVFTSVREHTRVSYAKMITLGGFCDIDLIIVKATSPDDIPLPNKYVNELLKIFSISPSAYRAFALSFTRRFGRTCSWRVALKCLLLLHRLMRALPNDSPFRAELLWARTNGQLSLDPCSFRDRSSSYSDDYTAFVKSYARLLDEALECISIDHATEELETILSMDTKYEPEHEDENDLVPNKMEELGRKIEILPQLQSLMDRVVECRPGGAASRSFLVESAMKHIIRHSFSCYATFRREIVMVLDDMIQLPYRNCVAAFGIYKKASLQADHLSEFHDWCKSMGYCGSYEYPIIDRIPDIQVRALETFLNGMWQLTDQSSSMSNTSTQTMSSKVGSPTMSLGDDDDDEFDDILARGGLVKLDRKVEKDMETEPLLIEWVDEDENSSNVGWEDLLEASICVDSRNDWVHDLGHSGQGNGLQMQVYNPTHFVQISNPFHPQPHLYYGSCPNTPMHTWDLI